MANASAENSDANQRASASGSITADFGPFTASSTIFEGAQTDNCPCFIAQSSSVRLSTTTQRRSLPASTQAFCSIARSWMRRLASAAQELQLALDAIDEVGYGLGWFWLLPYLELRLNDFGLLSQVPAARHGRLRLRVRFADRHLARRFAEQLRFARAEHLHRSIDGSLPATSSETDMIAPPPLPKIAQIDANPPGPVSEELAERQTTRN